MNKIKEIFYDENGKELDLSGPALRKQDALAAKGSKKASKKDSEEKTKK